MVKIKRKNGNIIWSLASSKSNGFSLFSRSFNSIRQLGTILENFLGSNALKSAQYLSVHYSLDNMDFQTFVSSQPYT